MTHDEVLADRVHAAVAELNEASHEAERSGLKVYVTVDLVLEVTKKMMKPPTPTYMVKADVSKPLNVRKT